MEESETVFTDQSANEDDEMSQLVEEQSFGPVQKAFLKEFPAEDEHNGIKLLSPTSYNEESKDKREQNKCSRDCIYRLFATLLLLIACGLVNACFSMMAPFYPSEADARHVSSAVVGTVVSITPLTVAILAPVFGFFLPKLGVKYLLNSGLILVGGSYILIGFLHHLEKKLDFIILSLALRVVEGVGSAAFYTASIRTACGLFPESTGTIMGLIEVFSAVGFLIGPPIGGLLHQVGGFRLPFFVTGGSTLLFVISFIVVLPKPENVEAQFISLKTLFKLLKDIQFVMLVFVIIISEAALVFFMPCLSLYLIKEFGFTTFQVGLAFLPTPLAYMFGSIVTGQLTDKLGPRWLLCLGLIVSGVPYFFMGPAPYITQHKIVAVTMISMAIIGGGCAMSLVPVYTDMCAVGKRVDPDCDSDTLSSLVSGILSGFLFFGEFVGPLLSGSFTSQFSFEESNALFGEIVVASGILVTGITAVDILFEKFFSKRKPKKKMKK